MNRALTLISLVGVLFGCGGESILEPGVPVSRAIGVGDSHPYRIDLQAGDFLELVLDQDGDNMGLVLKAPEGRQILEVDTPNGPLGRERFFAVAEVSGAHRAEVKLYGQVGGAYTLRALVRRASGEDRQRALACRLMFKSWLAEDTGPAAHEAEEQALRLWEKLGEPYLATVALLRLGQLHRARGENDQAIERFNQARERLDTLETRDLEPAVLIDLAGAQVGTPDLARTTYENALTAARRERDRWREGIALNDFAVLLYRTRRQPWFALGLLDQALDVFRELHDLERQANAQLNRGLVLNWLGREEPALEAYSEALDLRSEITSDGRARSEILLEMGWVEMWRGNEERAEELMHAALAAVEETDHGTEAGILDRLGTLYFRQGRLAEARDAYRAALRGLDAGDRPADRAHTLSNLGRVYGELGETDEALECLDQALRIFEERRLLSGTAYARANRARVLRYRGDLRQATRELEEALRLHEELREEVRSPGFRSSYMETAYEHFQLYVDLLMELEVAEPGKGWAVLALDAVERSRARSLLELVVELGAERQRELGQGALVTERASLRRQVESLETELRALRAARAPNEKIEGKSRRLKELASDLDYLDGTVATPLTEPRKVDEILQVLDPDTSLLVYSLGETRGFVWLLGQDGLRGWKRLSSREALAALLRPLVDALREPSSSSVEAREIEDQLSVWGRELLPAGALTRRLVVIPDGVLFSLPFGALRVNDRYLAEDHEVSRLPSASVLLALRERRKKEIPPRTLLAVVADPVFGPEDPRLTPQAAAAARASRAEHPSGLDFLMRLPQSATEADRLVSRVAKSCRWQERGFGATREIVRGGRLEGASLLHFATHVLLQDELPELSQVVLSRFDSMGNPTPGSLYAFEIAEMALSADLVVLSACQTALGKEIRGEGLVGLPQSFFEAGADRVLVSLWDVDDTATAELMDHFYTGLLEQRLPPTEALRRAQEHLRRSEDWNAPFYWASFTLVGDWRELPSTVLDSSCLHP